MQIEKKKSLHVNNNKTKSVVLSFPCINISKKFLQMKIKEKIFKIDF